MIADLNQIANLNLRPCNNNNESARHSTGLLEIGINAQTQCATVGDRTIATAGAQMSNSLLPDIVA